VCAQNAGRNSGMNSASPTASGVDGVLTTRKMLLVRTYRGRVADARKKCGKCERTGDMPNDAKYCPWCGVAFAPGWVTEEVVVS
jgi:hypothetical protein